MHEDRWTVAAVIPAHNRADVLPRALESVLAQRRLPDEIVVVDDGSIDGTAATVSRYGNAVTLLGRPRGGVSAARNAGVAASSSDFVAFLDSDDVWEPGHLSRMGAAVEATRGRACLYFSDLRLDRAQGGGSLWALSGFSIDEPYELRETDKAWLFLARQPIMIPASIIRRDAYLAVGGSDPTLVRRSDTHLIFKLGLADPVCAVPGVAGTATETDPLSLTRTYPPDHPVYLRSTAWLYADLLRNAGPLSAQQRRILRQRIARAYLSLARQKGERARLGSIGLLLRAIRNDPAVLGRRAYAKFGRTARG